MGFVYDTNRDAEAFISAVMPGFAYKGPDGSVHIGIGACGKPEPFKHLQDRFDLATASCVVGASNTQKEVQLSVFNASRHGCRAFWSFHSLYNIIGFSQAGGNENVWAMRCLEDWEPVVACHLGASKQLLRSRPFDGSLVPHDECGSRVLDWPAPAVLL